MRTKNGKTNPVNKALAACRSAFASTGLLSCAINLLMLTGPLFMLQIYDRVLSSRSIPTLLALATLVGVLFCFYGLFDMIRARIHVRIGRHVDEQLRAVSFDKVLSSTSRKDEQPVGVQPLSDLGSLRKFIGGPGPSAFFDMPWTVIFIGVIYLMHPMLGLLALFAALILFGLAVVNDLTTRKPLQAAAQSTRVSLAMAEENRRNAEAIHVMGMASAVRNRWLKYQSESLADHVKGMDRSALNVSTSRTLRLMFQSAVLGLGAYLAVHQEISPGTMIAASIIMARALAPIEICVVQWPQYLSFRGALNRLKEMLQDGDAAGEPIDLPVPGES